MSAQTRSEIADLLAGHGLTPVHRLGQHFLADANITRKIVGVAQITEGGRVVEVGAGTGTLTRALAAAGASVVAYEVDERLLPILETVTEGLDVDLRIADVTRVDFNSALGGGRWVMVANLPYNVGTPLLMDTLRHVMAIDRFVVMVQHEVAVRLTAPPGSSEYGLPSVVAGIYTEARLEFRVPPHVFYPQPKVDSAVVRLDRTPVPLHADLAVDLARAAFGQRRKMLRRSLVGALEDPKHQLEEAGLDPTWRAEDVPPRGYLGLAEVIA